MRHNVRCWITLLLLSANSAFAQQVTGSISGSVTDASGAAVATARLKLVSAATGSSRQVLTDEAGNFVISSVDPGEYHLTAQAPGFKTFERKGVILTASERLSVGNISLALGSLEERVTVTAEGTAVQTVSAERSAAITGTQVENLLIYGRSVASLVALAPGVVDPTGAAGRDLGGGNATSFNVLGNRAAENNFTIDGVTLTATGGAPVNVGYSLVSATDLSGTPSISPRILVVGDPVLAKGDRTFSRNFRTDVFRVPAAGSLGFMSKNMLRGPGVNNWDVALFKNFTLHESFRFQFRSEFYNAFNHTQFSTFDSTARFDATGAQVNGQFGQFTAARDPRILQLAIRLQF